jgi:hypothetical protein
MNGGYMQKVAYIAGPYSAKTRWGRIINIYRAAKVALKYWELGYAVVCPQMNTALYGDVWFRKTKCNYETWLAGDMEILSRCDVVVFMRRWVQSPGALREWDFAVAIGKEIVYD